MTIRLLAIAITFLTIGGSARAALDMSGSLGVIDFPGGGSFTSSSLMLSPSTLIIAETGIFASLVPNFSTLTSYAGTLTGLSPDPKAENVNDFFVFSTPNSSFGSPGTTPNSRFEFNLDTLSEVQTADFVGTGTLVDSLGVYASSPAIFDLSFSTDCNYSFALETIPEPNQYGILGGICAFLPILFGVFRRGLSRES
jgi:hypothetical protein